MHVLANLPSIGGDFFHQRARHVDIRVLGHQKGRFYARLEVAIGQRQLKLVLEIGEDPQPTNDDSSTQFSAETDEQPLKRAGFDVREVPRRGTEQLQTLVDGKQAGRRFLWVEPDRERDPFIEARGPLYDRGMAERDGVEASRVDRVPVVHGAAGRAFRRGLVVFTHSAFMPMDRRGAQERVDRLRLGHAKGLGLPWR